MRYNDSGVLTLTITGLPGNNETVRVERHVDGNGNGSIDAGEPLILSFLVTDGQVAMFGGERNFNIPGDEDGAANGQIRVELSPGQLPEFNRAVGNYLFRISSPSAAFAPMVQPFAVMQAPFGQAVRGTVTAGGSPVPGALVAFLNVGNDGNYEAGVLTDAAGAFSLNVAPGDYQLAAVKSGFVMHFLEGPQATVTTGVDVTQNVAVAAADRTISGRVFDAVSSNGLPAVQIFVGSLGDEAITVVHADADGNFSIPVLSGTWMLEPSEEGLALLGYTSGELVVDASAGSVSDVMMPLTYGRGQLELVFFFPGGSFGSGTNGMIPFPTHLNYYYALYGLEDVNFPTNVYFTGPSGSGLSNTPSAVFGGSFGGGDEAWYSSPQVYLPPYPPGGVYTVNYKGQDINFRLPDPDAQNRQVLLVPTATVSTDNVLEHIRWTVRDMNGNAVAMPPSVTGIEIRIDGIGGRLYEGDVTPEETEHFLMGYVVWTNVSYISMVYDDNAGNQYVAFWNRGSQPLQILTSSNLPPAQLGVPYQHLFVVAGGQSPYTWSLPVPDAPPPGLMFGGTGELQGIPTAEGSFTFTARVTDMNQQFLDKTVTLLVQPAMSFPRVEPVLPITPGQFRVRVAGQSGQSYTLQYSTTLTSWTDVVTVTAPADNFELVDPTASDSSRLYRVRRNQ